MKTQFKIFNYYVNNIITSKHISLAINKLYKEKFTDLKYDSKIAILFKIKTMNGSLKNISSLQIVDKTNLDDLVNIFNTFLKSKSHTYLYENVENIVFTYKYLEYPLITENSIFNYPTDFDISGALLPEDYEDLPNNIQIEK
jgi:hypothetical protein